MAAPLTEVAMKNHAVRGFTLVELVIVMVIIFIVRIYYLKTRFVNGFAGILRVQFCALAAQSSRNFLSDLSIDDEEGESKPCESKASGAVETFRVHGCRP